MQPARVARGARSNLFPFLSSLVLRLLIAGGGACRDVSIDRAARRKRLLISAARPSFIGAGSYFNFTSIGAAPANCTSFN